MLLALLAMTTIHPVTISGSEGHWQLMRDGKPYFVKGAGGINQLQELVAAGGNSVRTWGAETIAKDLDTAEAHGLTVAAGIWIQHKEGLDYGDPAKVAAQTAEVARVVRANHNHPALLVWGIGNEMENGNDTVDLWKAVGAAAHAAKTADPDHPIMTVVAEISDQKIAHIKQFAPDVDVLGVNSYGGLQSLPDRLKKAGWAKPYLVTEFGPLGFWELGKTAWGAPQEQTSTEKAAFYANDYEHSIAGQPGWCLGGYAFLWGHKQEATPTWFGMFLPTGEATAAVDVMQHEWSGSWPAHRAPAIEPIKVGGSVDNVEPGAMISASVKVVGNPDVSYRWSVLPEVLDRRADGNGENTPSVVNVIADTRTPGQVMFHAPKEPGAYRLYLVVATSAKRAACANVPFRVGRG